MKLKAQISPPEPRCGYRINKEAALLWTRRVLERLQAVQNQQGSTGRLPWHNEANGSSVLIGDRLTVNPAGKQSEFVPGLLQGEPPLHKAKQTGDHPDLELIRCMAVSPVGSVPLKTGHAPLIGPMVQAIVRLISMDAIGSQRF